MIFDGKAGTKGEMAPEKEALIREVTAAISPFQAIKPCSI